MINHISFQQPLDVLWDSDGSMDGVVGLLYFLQHPGINIKALTISCGLAHPDIYISNLPRMLARLGRDFIPAAAGSAMPLKSQNAFPAPWRQEIDRFLGIDLPEVEEPHRSLTATDLMIKTLNKSPDPITLFECGTHTNLAGALRESPSIKQKINRVQMMGGSLFINGNVGAEWPEIDNDYAEWNIWVDPYAAKEVFNAGLPIYISPLDTTNQVVWTYDDAETWETSGTLEGQLAAEILRWYLGYLKDFYPDGVYLWDLVASVCLTNPEFFQEEKVYIEVITEQGNQEGRTKVIDDRKANAAVFLRPNADAIKKHVAGILALPRGTSG